MRLGIAFGWVSALFVVTASVASAQDLETVITTKSGSVLTIPPDTVYTIDNFGEEESQFVMTPREAGRAARASIRRGSETTEFSANRIVYYPNKEDFLLDGNARVKSANDQLSGPVRIQFFASQNMIVAEGTQQNPARFEYFFDDGRTMKSSSRLFHFYFTRENGGRVLNRIESKP